MANKNYTITDFADYYRRVYSFDSTKFIYDDFGGAIPVAEDGKFPSFMVVGSRRATYTEALDELVDAAFRWPREKIDELTKTEYNKIDEVMNTNMEAARLLVQFGRRMAVTELYMKAKSWDGDDD